MGARVLTFCIETSNSPNSSVSYKYKDRSGERRYKQKYMKVEKDNFIFIHSSVKIPHLL